MDSLGGPYAAAAGAVIGAFTRSDVDNWRTVATQAEQGYDWNEFFNRPENADLRAEFSKPDVQSLFQGNPEAYASWWKRQFDGGNNETGRVVNRLPGTGPAPGAATPASGTSPNAPGFGDPKAGTSADVLYPGQNQEPGTNPNAGGAARPTTGLGSSTPGVPNATQTPDEAQEAAWNDYQQTPWARIGTMEANRARDEYTARAGASGSALSGRTLRGTAEVAGDAQLRNFNGYYGALGGFADTGFNADTGIASAGQNFASSNAQVLSANARAQSDAAIARGNTQQGMYEDLASIIGWGSTKWGNGSGSSTKSTTPLGGSTSTGIGTIARPR